MRAENVEPVWLMRDYRGRCRSALRQVFIRRLILVPVVAIVFFCASVNSGALTSESKSAGEYRVKAAFLYNFVESVNWPSSAFSDSKQPLVVCVYGRDPFGRALEDSLLGKSIGDRRLGIGRANQLLDLPGCHVVFIAGSDGVRIADAVNYFRGRPVLLVGESEGFAAAGGAIQFTMEEGRVRFVINPDAADRANLKISSKLLALAKIVRDSSPSVAGSAVR